MWLGSPEASPLTSTRTSHWTTAGNEYVCKVLDFTDDQIDIAAARLSQFFAEGGFVGTGAGVAANISLMAADPPHWIGLAWAEGIAVGVVTATTMLYIEWGWLGEIGDIFVLPFCETEWRRHSPDRRSKIKVPEP